jgi:glutamate 5-kinase
MKRIVVKIGSNILADDKEGLDTKRISSIASDISALQDKGYEVVVVSSGAFAAGMRKLGLKEKPKDVKLKQAAAAVGQSSLMWAYERGFSGHGKKVAQVLLTRNDLSDRKRYINAKNTSSPFFPLGWCRSSMKTILLQPMRSSSATMTTLRLWSQVSWRRTGL